MPESKLSNAPENNYFAVSFTYLKLRKVRDNYKRVGESKGGVR